MYQQQLATGENLISGQLCSTNVSSWEPWRRLTLVFRSLTVRFSSWLAATRRNLCQTPLSISIRQATTSKVERVPTLGTRYFQRQSKEFWYSCCKSLRFGVRILMSCLQACDRYSSWSKSWWAGTDRGISRVILDVVVSIEMLVHGAIQAFFMRTNEFCWYFWHVWKALFSKLILKGI